MNASFAGKLPGTARLLLGVSFLAIVWCGVLPKLSHYPFVEDWIDPLRKRGINPSAMYYTDVFETPNDGMIRGK